ncbi:MAG TPA: hypothetical protein ENJ86_11925 [Methylothermaceae bacterium]|nr:hypothetical protein [Methylothermaceae bacterium]
MKRNFIGLLTGLLWLAASECQALGKLFFSPTQRALLDRPPAMAKMPKKTATRQSSRSLATRLDGIVRGSSRTWIWFDGKLKKSGAPPLTPIPVDENQVTLYWRGRRLKLRPGQKLTAGKNGTVRIKEAFGP